MLKLHARLPDLPMKLGDEACLALGRFLGVSTSESHAWLKLALTHSSYINECGLEPRIVGLLRACGSLLTRYGFDLLTLAINHWANDNLPSASCRQVDEFRQKVEPMIIGQLADELELGSRMFIGRGEASAIKDGKVSAHLLRSSVESLLGVVGIFSSYGRLYQRVDSCVQQASLRQGDVSISYKSLLQEVSQGLGRGTPLYEVVMQSGPDHSKQFRVRVRTQDGHSAEGEGPSKKQAEEVSARTYLERYLPNRLPRSDSVAHALWRRPLPPYLIPSQHREGVLKLCATLGMPENRAWLLSQALTHSSFLNETRLSACCDGRRLAQLGAAILGVLSTETILARFLGDKERDQAHINQIRGKLTDASLLSSRFDVLGLERLVLSGRGYGQKDLGPVAKADVFAGVVAALFLARGSLDILRTSDAFITDWLNESAGNVDDLLLREPSEVNAMGTLEVQLQRLGIRWRFDYDRSGPVHEATYTARLTLESIANGETFSPVAERHGSSQKKAELALAAFAARAIESVNLDADGEKLGGSVSDDEYLRLAGFLYRHELETAPNDVPTAKRWLKDRLLGSHLLIGGQTEAFLGWANRVERLLEQDGKKVPNLHRVERFYTILRSLSTPSTQRWYDDAIASVRRLVERLNPELKQVDVRETPEFQDLLGVSKMTGLTRLLSREVTRRNLVDIVEDFLLLRTKRQDLRLKGSLPNAQILEREGTYLVLLDEAMLLLQSGGALLPGQVVYLSVSHDLQESLLEIELQLPEDGTVPSDPQEHIDYGPVWPLLRSLAHVLWIRTYAGSLKICCALQRDDDSFGARALKSFEKEDEQARLENEVLSRLFHDLKTHLIAYQVALDLIGEGRTRVLEAKLDASRHLDAAVTILASVEAIGHATASPPVEAIDIRQFARDYVMDKTATLPENIRFDPPRTLESCQFWTAPTFVRSILDNLVNNAKEAMPSGGEISLDWVFDAQTASLLLEVSDTGPGIPVDLQRSLLTGEPVKSTKRQGSGVGLFTVHSMLRRLGGRLELLATPSTGTRWAVTLPSLPPD